MNGIGNIKLLYLDTSPFIYHFESHPQFGRLAGKIFTKLDKNEFAAVTSIITLTELLSAPYLVDDTEPKENFYSTSNLSVLDIDQRIAVDAARLRREYRFRLGDSIQLATALIAKADAFITNDVRLKTFKEIKVILLSEFH